MAHRRCGAPPLWRTAAVAHRRCSREGPAVIATGPHAWCFDTEKFFNLPDERGANARDHLVYVVVVVWGYAALTGSI